MQNQKLTRIENLIFKILLLVLLSLHYIKLVIIEVKMIIIEILK